MAREWVTLSSIHRQGSGFSDAALRCRNRCSDFFAAFGSRDNKIGGRTASGNRDGGRHGGTVRMAAGQVHGYAASWSECAERHCAD